MRIRFKKKNSINFYVTIPPHQPSFVAPLYPQGSRFELKLKSILMVVSTKITDFLVPCFFFKRRSSKIFLHIFLCCCPPYPMGSWTKQTLIYTTWGFFQTSYSFFLAKWFWRRLFKIVLYIFLHYPRVPQQKLQISCELVFMGRFLKVFLYILICWNRTLIVAPPYPMDHYFKKNLKLYYMRMLASCSFSGWFFKKF